MSDQETEFDNPVADTFERDSKPESFEADNRGEVKSPRSRESARQKREAKKAARLAAAQHAAEFQMLGKSLGLLEPDSPVRIVCFRITTNWIFEHLILVLILFAPCVLVLQMPAYVHELSQDSLNIIHALDIATLCIFTVESAMKIIALGFVRGQGTYLRNAWNRLDFFLVAMTWCSIILNRETPLFKLFRALRALRPLRKLRLMAGLAAILEFYPYILNVCAFLVFFMSIFGAVGVQMLGGVTSYRCVDIEALDASASADSALYDCPINVPCNDQRRCILAEDSLSVYPDDRIHEVKIVGFDNILQSFLTQFVVTTLDEWPAISHPISDVNGQTAFFVWPFFMTQVLVLSVITANLFVSVICYAFGNAEGLEDAATVAARVKKVRALFDRFDKDKSGEIESKEIHAVAETVGVALTEDEMSTALWEMDYDGSGMVDFEEFAEWWRSTSTVAARIRRAVVHEEALIQSAFEKIDLDGNKTLDRNEVNQLAFQMGITLVDAELKQCMFEMDADGSNEVDYSEFTSWWFSGSKVAEKVARAAKGEEAKLQALFNKLDVNSSGSLDIADFVEHGSAAFGFTIARPQAVEILKEMSAGQEAGDAIGLGAFIAWWSSDADNAKRIRSEQQADEARCRAMFDRIDSDGSGRLQSSEIVLMCKTLNIDISAKEADDLIEEIDSGFDSEVEFPEFYVWVCQESPMALKIKAALKNRIEEESKPAFPYIPGFSDALRRIINLSTFEFAVMAVVVVNTTIMALEHHEQPAALTDFVLYTEVLFTIIYIVEALMKIFGLGLLPYFKQPLNRLDFLICISSVMGLFMKELAALASLRIARLVVKLLRVLRMIKVLAKYDAVVLLLKTVVGSSGLLGSLSSFILFILALFALIGGHMLGTCHTPKQPGEISTGMEFGEPDFPRSNFYYFGSGIITNFQIMSGEDWAPVMYDYMHCSGNWAATYFVIMVLLMNFFLLNIFVAVILENFELSEEEKQVKQEQRFIDVHGSLNDPDKQKEFVVNWMKKKKQRGSKGPSDRKVAKVVRKGMELDTATTPADSDEDESLEERSSAELDVEHWSMTRAKGLDGADVALHCFSVENGCRKCCIAITRNHYFDDLVLFVIFISSIILAIEGPPDAPYLDSDAKLALQIANWTVFLFFWIELIIKVIADGFAWTPNGYIMDSWNRLDFFVVLVSTVDVVLSLLGFGAWVRTLRLLRVLRPLRILKHNEGMRVVMDAIIKCIPTVTAVIALSALFYITFAILGVGLFAGKFYRCDCGGNWGRPVRSCTHADPASLDREPCTAQGGLWQNPPYHFDNVLSAMRTLFICSTTEGWIDIMYSGMDVTEVYKAPVREAAFENFAFFAVFIIFGSFFVTNIFIGVLVNFFGESSGSALLTNQQKEWLQTQALCMTVVSREPPLPTNSLRLAVYKFVFSTFFEIAISVSIVVNVSMLMVEHVDMEKNLAEWLHLLNLIFLVLFTIELLLRVVAQGLRDYLADSWLRLDAFIVITSWITVVFETYSGFQAIRALRVMRILMVLKNARTLRSLFATMVLSLPPAANLTALLCLVFFVFAVVGMQLYGNMPHGQYVNANDNFDNVINAMCLLFQISTGQDFMNLTFEMEIAGRSFVFAYFCSFIIATIWVFFNLFVAVLLENFENNFTAAEMELSMWHVAHFKQMWIALTSPPEHNEIFLADFKTFIPRLHAPLSRVVDEGPSWFNRVLLELDMDFNINIDEKTVGFHEALLALCLISQSYDGLSVEEQQQKRAQIQACKEQHALRVLTWCTRIWLLMRNPPSEFNGRPIVTDDEKESFRRSIACVRLLLLDSMVRTGKVIKSAVARGGGSMK